MAWKCCAPFALSRFAFAIDSDNVAGSKKSVSFVNLHLINVSVERTINWINRPIVKRQTTVSFAAKIADAIVYVVIEIVSKPVNETFIMLFLLAQWHDTKTRLQLVAKGNSLSVSFLNCKTSNPEIESWWFRQSALRALMTAMDSRLSYELGISSILQIHSFLEKHLRDSIFDKIIIFARIVHLVTT